MTTKSVGAAGAVGPDIDITSGGSPRGVPHERLCVRVSHRGPCASARSDVGGGGVCLVDDLAILMADPVRLCPVAATLRVFLRAASLVLGVAKCVAIPSWADGAHEERARECRVLREAVDPAWRMMAVSVVAAHTMALGLGPPLPSRSSDGLLSPRPACAARRAAVALASAACRLCEAWAPLFSASMREAAPLASTKVAGPRPTPGWAMRPLFEFWTAAAGAMPTGLQQHLRSPARAAPRQRHSTAQATASRRSRNASADTSPTRRGRSPKRPQQWRRSPMAARGAVHGFLLLRTWLRGWKAHRTVAPAVGRRRCRLGCLAEADGRVPPQVLSRPRIPRRPLQR